MKKSSFLLLSLLLIIASIKVSGQKVSISGPIDSTNIYSVELKDGSTHIGNIISKDSAILIMKTPSIPRMEIPVDNVVSIEELNKTDYDYSTYRFPNPHATKYLISPSAFMLKQGEGYYQNTLVFLNSFNVGILNNFSFGGGIEFISTFATLGNGNLDPIFFLTPKVGFKVTDKFHAGGGILYVSIPSIDSEPRTGLGITYGMATYGTVDDNLTGSIGWGFIEGDFSGSPVISVSGMTRIAKHAALITENWLIPTEGYYGIFSYGIRFFGDNTSVDLAFINNSDIAESLFVGIPFVDFVVKF